MSTANKAPYDSDSGSLISYSADHLANQFLIAMPGMVDANFAGSVIYLFEHNARGAMGLVVNKPTEVDLATLFDKIELKLEIAPLLEQPVYFGGPVQIERGFVLHESNVNLSYSSSLIIPGGLTMTTSKDVLEAVAIGNGPRKFLMTSVITPSQQSRKIIPSTPKIMKIFFCFINTSTSPANTAMLFA